MIMAFFLSNTLSWMTFISSTSGPKTQNHVMRHSPQYENQRNFRKSTKDGRREGVALRRPDAVFHRYRKTGISQQAWGTASILKCSTQLSSKNSSLLIIAYPWGGFLSSLNYTLSTSQKLVPHQQLLQQLLLLLLPLVLLLLAVPSDCYYNLHYHSQAIQGKPFDTRFNKLPKDAILSKGYSSGQDHKWTTGRVIIESCPIA